MTVSFHVVDARAGAPKISPTPAEPSSLHTSMWLPHISMKPIPSERSQQLVSFHVPAPCDIANNSWIFKPSCVNVVISQTNEINTVRKLSTRFIVPRVGFPDDHANKSESFKPSEINVVTSQFNEINTVLKLSTICIVPRAGSPRILPTRG